MTYAGKARFTEKDEATKTVVLEASGKETRGSGTASATIRSSLQDEGGQTRVLVRTTMTVTGRPAQFGRGVMAEVGGRIIGKFATNLAAELSGEGAVPQGAAAAPAAGGAAAGEAAGSASTAAAQAPAAAGAEASGLPDPAQLPIEELNLPVRSFNSLRREGVHTVGGLAAPHREGTAGHRRPRAPVDQGDQGQAGRAGLALTTPGVTADAATGAPPRPARPPRPRGRAGQHGTAAGTAGTRPAAVSPAAPGRVLGRGHPSAERPAANGLLPPRGARPQDEDALDLLSVAGLPLLKRFAPLLAALIFAGVLLRIVRRRRRASRA